MIERQIDSHIPRRNTFKSVNRAGDVSTVSTSMVAQRSGSLISGRSSKASIGPEPSRCHNRSYSWPWLSAGLTVWFSWRFAGDRIGRFVAGVDEDNPARVVDAFVDAADIA
jgi:hypothetical protein